MVLPAEEWPGGGLLMRVPEIVRDLVNESLSYIPVISKRHVWPAA